MHARAGKLSPFQLYQFLLGSVPDVDVCAFLRQLTFLPLADIAALEARLGAPGYAPNTAQRLLASEVTRFVHGEPGLQAALAATAVRLAPCCVIRRLLGAVCAWPFGSLRSMPRFMHVNYLTSGPNSSTHGPAHRHTPMLWSQPQVKWLLKALHAAGQALAPGADTQLDAAALEAVAAGAPAADLPRCEVVGAPLADVLAAIGLQPSKAAARRLIKACPASMSHTAH